MDERRAVVGLCCAVCGAAVDIRDACSWRCPNSTEVDRHHVLQLVRSAPDDAPLSGGVGASDPFLRFRHRFAWDAFAAANGMDDASREGLVARLDGALRGVAGVGLHVTPFARHDALSTALGFSIRGGVWVKDETGQVAGSHKARHLASILLHLLVGEELGIVPWSAHERPHLAIASCGNAAFAAATLAAAADWPLRVFVPPTARPVVLDGLRRLHATVVLCPRRDADPAGDPCMHRFREEVQEGAIPFTVQGPENAWCLDGGRTIGWEMAEQMGTAAPSASLDRVFVQVGAGTFAACVAAGLRSAGARARVHAVQTTSCAPLARAWEAAEPLGDIEAAAAAWSDCMWPWEHVGDSAADGILDDETYDWLAVIAAMRDSGGAPIVADESAVTRAYELARAATGIDVSATGSAGLAGLLSQREHVGDDERVAVIFSGLERR